MLWPPCLNQPDYLTYIQINAASLVINCLCTLDGQVLRNGWSLAYSYMFCFQQKVYLPIFEELPVSTLTYKKHKGTRHHASKHWEDETSGRDMLSVKVLKHRYAKTLEDIVCIEQTGKHLQKVGHHITPADGQCPVDIEKGKNEGQRAMSVDWQCPVDTQNEEWGSENYNVGWLSLLSGHRERKNEG